MARLLTSLLRTLVVATALLLAAGVKAQTPTPAPPAPKTQPAPVSPKMETPPSTQELDTGESLTYMGRKLWFEMKRRLNLTTEEEEKAQKAEERNVRLKLGGIQVQGTAPATTGK
ncbi:MAG: hypothetical protein JNL52_13175 [Flavobacteriales bacterium]|nr:hypothetical protein [Flavobacteriales bacterium]